MSTTFIGLDVAWEIEGNHSGVAILCGSEEDLQLIAISKDLISSTAVFDFIAEHAAQDAVLAVDASLVVRNQTGQRACETAIGRAFGKYHSSCHTTNLGKTYALTGANLVKALESLGFVHEFDLSKAMQRAGRWIFEVYPHPAMIQLFRLQQIIKYKKGKVAEKRTGLAVLRENLHTLPGLTESPLQTELLGVNLESLKGETLKRYEDSLDALFCSYLAWHCWRWGAEKNDVFGTLQDGYIVVPKGHVKASE